MIHAVRYRPVKVSDWNPDLSCFVTRTVGYRAVCSCGGRSKVCPTVADSRSAPVEHVAPASGHGTIA